VAETQRVWDAVLTDELAVKHGISVADSPTEFDGDLPSEPLEPLRGVNVLEDDGV